jgi:hypothetical protein
MSGEISIKFSEKATSEVAEDLILEMSCEGFLLPGRDVTQELRTYAYERYVPGDLQRGSPLISSVMREYLESVDWDDVTIAVNAFREDWPSDQFVSGGRRLFLVRR